MGSALDPVNRVRVGRSWRRAVGVAVLIVALLLALAAPASGQSPTPQIISLTIDPPSPKAGQSVTLQVICDHSGPVAFDDIDVAAGVGGGAIPDNFQDDVASNGGVDWTARSDSPLPGAGIHAVRVGVFTWSGTGPGSVLAGCSSSHGADAEPLFFNQPVTTDPSASTSSPPVTSEAGATTAAPPANEPVRSVTGLPPTGGASPGLWMALPVVGGTLLVLLSRWRARELSGHALTAPGAADDGARRATQRGEPARGTRSPPRAPR